MKKSRTNSQSLAVLATATAYFVSAAGLQAQQTNETDDSDIVDLGTITVQARRFDETAVAVPISSSVVNREVMDITPSSRLSEEIRTAPNVNASSTGVPRFSQFNIRGLGALNLDAADDTSVGTYVNGVPIPRQSADFQLLDVEQVEILRGPQGTLFGDTSSAGAINVITREAPTGDEGEVRLSFDDHGNLNAGFLLGTRINDRAAFRFSAASNTLDASIPDLTLGRDVGELKEVAARAVAFYDFTDTVSGEFTFDYSSFDTDHPSWVFADAPVEPSAAQAQADDSRQVSRGFSAKFTFDLDGVEAQSVTSYRDIDATVFTDNIDVQLDAGLPFAMPGTVFTTENDETQTYFFQELLFRSSTDSGLVWQAGVNYRNDGVDTTFTDTSESPAFPGFPVVSSTNTEIESEHFAIFGEADVPLSDKVSLTLGGRYSKVQRDADVSFATFGSAASDSASASFSGFSGRVGLSYEPNLDQLYYATLSRGWKPGGFQRFQSNIAVTGSVDPTFNESSNVTFELGHKRTFDNGRGAFNFAAFYTEAEDEQIVNFDFNTFQLAIDNADVRSAGFEADVAYQLTDRFNISGSVGYTDAVFTSDRVAAGISKGNHVPNVPRWSAGLNGTYVAPVKAFGAGADWVTSASAVFRSEREADSSNTLTLDEHVVVNLSTGIQSGNWGARIYVENLFDETYETSAILNPNGRVGVVRGQERTIGIEFSAKW